MGQREGVGGGGGEVSSELYTREARFLTAGGGSLFGKRKQRLSHLDLGDENAYCSHSRSPVLSVHHQGVSTSTLDASLRAAREGIELDDRKEDHHRRHTLKVFEHFFYHTF